MRNKRDTIMGDFKAPVKAKAVKAVAPKAAPQVAAPKIAAKAAPVPAPVAAKPEVAPAAIVTKPEAAPVPVAVVAAPAVEAAETVVTAVEQAAAKIIPTITETKAAPKTVRAATKEAVTMVEQFKTAAQTAFTKTSDKARETLDKTVKGFEEAGEFAKGNVEALVASGKAATAGAEKLAQEAAEFSKKNFEAGSAHLQTLAATRTPADVFKLQSDFAKSQFDGMVAEMSKSTELMMKVMGDVFEPISNRFALAAEKVKSVAA